MLIKRDPEEIEAIRKLIKAGATFVGPDGDPLVEEAALQRLLMLNPNMVFGAIRQDPDARDIPARTPPPPTVQKVDLRPWASPVEDQLSIGSCAANAFVGLVELQDKEHNRFKDKSRLYLFYNAHDIAGTIGHDVGVTIRNIMKAAQKFGICNEATWPYDVNRCWVKPSQSCYTEGSQYKISAYKYLPSGDVNAAKGYLAQKYPIEFGFDVFKSFLGTHIALTGIMEMPSAGEKPQSGHAVDLVGFDDSKGWFIVRNSWSSRWGQGGYFMMPYEFYRKHSWDPWVVVV